MLSGTIPFLIGCSQKKLLPQSIRAVCLAVLGKLCQNNPAVQDSMLDHGSVPRLIDIYFAEYINSDSSRSIEGSSSRPVQEKAVQAMSSCTRNNDIAEKMFCMNQDGKKMIDCALGLYSHLQLTSTEDTTRNVPVVPSPSSSLRSKALIFLQQLITSDSSDQERVRSFAAPIQYISSKYLDPNIETDPNIRETALSMLTQIMEQKKSVNSILDMKSSIVGLGVQRVAEIRTLEGEEKASTEEELRLWEQLIMELSRGIRDELNSPDNEDSLAIPDGEPSPDSLKQ